MDIKINLVVKFLIFTYLFWPTHNLTIDNHLQVIKNDCYERLAIGQRLNRKAVHKMVNVNTVADCQMACTQEAELCKAFSFGIGVKGNGTCELSIDAIKETADLKPIGTLADTDFDLYIKKLGCSIVIDKNQHNNDQYNHQKPLPTIQPQNQTFNNNNYPKPINAIGYGNSQTQNHDHYGNQQSTPDHQQYPSNRPNQNHYNHDHYGNQQKPVQQQQSTPDRPSNRPNQNHYYGNQPNFDNRPQYSNLNNNYYVNKKPGYNVNENDEHHHVHTMVSVSPGLKPFLHPVHEILIGENPYLYAQSVPNQYNNNRPSSYRPPPYNDEHGSYGRPPNYRPRPDYYQEQNGYYYNDAGSSIDRFEYRPPRPPPPRPPSSNYPGDHDYFFDDHRRPPRLPPIPRPNDYLFQGDNQQRPPNHNDYQNANNNNNNNNIKKKPAGSILDPDNPNSDYGSSNNQKPNNNDDKNGGSYQDKNQIKGTNNGPKDIHSKPFVTQSVGPHGQTITSIITEIKDACFRRVLAGKRVARAFVRRSLICERIEDCQTECADEKHFACEGFNYRLDPSGRGKGECELLDLPVSRLDIGRDIYPDPDYDYYEKDRNAAVANCNTNNYNRGGGPPYYGSSGGGAIAVGFHDGGSGGSFHDSGSYPRRPDNYPDYPDDRRRRRPPPPPPPLRPSDFDRRHDYYYDDDDDNDDYPPGNRRGDFVYHHDHHQHHHHQHQQSYHYQFDNDNGYHGNYNHDQHYLPPHYHDSDNKDKSRPPPPPPPYDYKSYEPYLPPNRQPPPSYYNKKPYNDYQHHNYYGSDYGYSNNNRRFYNDDRRPPLNNHYLPSKFGGTKDWGQYGGSYGNGGANLQYHGYGHSQSFDYWGFNKYDHRPHGSQGVYGDLYPPKPTNTGSYLPEPPSRPRPPYEPLGPPRKPEIGIPQPPKRPPGSNDFVPEPPLGPASAYIPPPPAPPPPASPPNPPPSGYIPKQPPSGGGGGGVGDTYLPPRYGGHFESHHHQYGGGFNSEFYNNAILPAEPRRPPYNFLKEECSLRTATGFRLHKGLVKKFYAVPNVYECELLCFKEKEFPCASYAFRYSVGSVQPQDNCYLSNRNYKELDFYTDLQPDRDFDIYTMNNMQRCEQPLIIPKDNSDCFYRVRSAQRLDHKIVRDSLTVKSIVECQIECLRSTRFTCRAFAFRYGSPVIGGIIDNCQLTDWPFYELNPREHFVSEPGFEVYDRGSYGHGCEPDHFRIRGKPWKQQHETKIDQICYIGFGSPARILPQATKKVLDVPTELDCKIECSKLRHDTLFQCMSFSYRTGHGPGPNCLLSDILQRDLLPSVDYIEDPDWWLFAWDNYNPECFSLDSNHLGDGHGREGGEGVIEDRKGYYPINAMDTWRVYSVSGWPCRRGSLCRENREAGFWFCELEGGDSNAWDYCCRPDHQCGYSEGFPYQWCYVGPERTQWRKCSERYYPYYPGFNDRLDYIPPDNHIRDSWRPPPPRPPPPFSRPGIRPDRPPAPPTRPPPRPSLDEYEAEFDNQFLEPPKPGGFGQPRHWPLSYLHKEKPPINMNDTTEPRMMRTTTTTNNTGKFAAIQNLIDVIKSNDLKNIQYQISNESNKQDDILFVKIPLPTNFTQKETNLKRNVEPLKKISGANEPEIIDLFADTNSNNNNNSNNDNNNNNVRSQKSLPTRRFVPTYRKSYITRANVTNHARSRI